ncbi:hypothetical protein [Roseimicrobium sp. ORNL1]|uniref:hypothetical protein n=1 Tax=Roseimicrobium sp. ORNL1 TaxID=2711231 RepID=UPI0013E168C5|nr:hypothetical protein [Roseimicrobium sp. ORNL1]QIF01590.1 hypothetical protein G5S37_08660 [Roseimicrobium sp. ORNL1]
MKACSYLLAAAVLTMTLANCTTPQQHPTRATQQRPRPIESGYDDPDMVMLAQNVERRGGRMNIGFYQGWRD